MKVFVIVFLSLFIFSCGTMHNIKINKDKLTGKNICYISTLQQTDYITTGNPGAVTIFTYDDYKLEVQVMHFYPLVTVNKTNNLKETQARIDSNEIITIKDLNESDDVFIVPDQRALIEQMIKGNEMVLRVNYYNGHTKDFELNLSNFEKAWLEMKEKCAN